MADKTTFDIDVAPVVDALDEIAKNTEKQLFLAINDAAFALRKKWRDMIASDIDRPTSFTLKPGNVIVDKATANKPEANVRVGDIQARYLIHMVEGISRKGGDIATSKGQIVSTTKNSPLNQFGNFQTGPRRWIGRVKTRIPRGFIGTPQGGNQRAVYQRSKDGDGLKLLAVFIKEQPYKIKLPLYEIAQSSYEDAFRALNKKIDEILK